VSKKEKQMSRKIRNAAGWFLAQLLLATLFSGCTFESNIEALLRKRGAGEDIPPANTFTVTFNKNNADAGSAEANPQTMTVTPPAAGVGTLPAVPTRRGYAFIEWNTQADGGGTAFTEATTVTTSITVYAQWLPLIDIDMIYVPGGSFDMGKDLGTAATGDDTPVHTVTLSGFYMGKYPVTQAQYQAVMGSNPSSFNSNPASGETQGNRPVESVSWYDAIVFCNKLSMAEGLNPAYSISGSANPSDWGAVPNWGYDTAWDAAVIVSGANGYRLRTEAQWEYAAKGGNGSPGNYTYAGSDNADAVAWYSSNSGSMTHEVGKKAANGLGLYDMSGNVWEWCWDWWGSYSSGAQTDPTGAVSGADRVVRGGGWHSSAENVRSAVRAVSYPLNRFISDGFRLVRP
jgi:uncharacterized repeat protein (TIGR02543 family)